MAPVDGRGCLVHHRVREHSSERDLRARDGVPRLAPVDVAGFNEALVGVGDFVMPATQHDAVLWISGIAYDVVFDTARDAIAALTGLASVADETSSWP